MGKYNLLLVDDDPFILEGIGSDLEYRGYRVTRAASGEKAVSLLETFRFDLVITDLVMGQTSGIQVLRKTKQLHTDAKVMILTGFGDMHSAIDALRFHADDYLIKPCESEEMVSRVKNCLEDLEMDRRISLHQKILPMCCVCKDIRDDTGKEPGTGRWVSIERFIHDHAGVDITSSYCPKCAHKTMESFTRNKH